MRLCVLQAAVLAAAGCCLAGPASEPAGGLLEFPHAGVALALEAGLEPRPVAEPFDIVRAVRSEGDKPVLAVTLSAFPAGPAVTADSYAEAMLAELRKNLSIRNLELRSRTQMKVAGIAGSAQLISYTYRGAKTTAGRVYVIRDLKKADLRLCYVLTVEAPSERESAIVPALKQAAESIRLIDLRHFGPLPAQTLRVGSYKHGFELSVPVGWHVSSTPGGLAAGQTDYLLEGLALPTATVMAAEAPQGESAEPAAKKALAAARASAAAQDLTIELLSQGEAPLAGTSAHQYVLLQKPSEALGLPEAKGMALVIIQRTIVSAPPAAGAARSYSLIVIARHEDRKHAEGLMDKLAGSFRLIEPQPQTATQPTQTAPAARAAAEQGS